MSKVKYRMGDEVAHIDSLGLKMRVRKIAYENNQLSHIVCDWASQDTTKPREKGNFHSNELVLWSIAEKGQDYVDSYFEAIRLES